MRRYSYYAVSQQYHAARQPPVTPPDRHFITEFNPEVEDAVDYAMELAERGKTNEAWLPYLFVQ